MVLAGGDGPRDLAITSLVQRPHRFQNGATYPILRVRIASVLFLEQNQQASQSLEKVPLQEISQSTKAISVGISVSVQRPLNVSSKLTVTHERDATDAYAWHTVS